MKAALTVKEKTIEYADLPDPSPGPEQVCLKVRYAGICGSDLHVYRGEFAGRVKFPRVQGHEFSGVVDQVGERVTGLKKGDRVCVDPIISCRTCSACLAGAYNACRNLKLLGIDLDGGFAGQVLAGAEQCFKVGDSLSDRDAALVELYSIGMHSTTVSAIEPGDLVVVLGAGRVGLSVLENLLQTAAERVIVTDPRPAKLELASRLGAAAVINPAEVDAARAVEELTGGRGADCVIECVGQADLYVAGGKPPIAQAVEMVRNAGRITVMGQGPESYGLLWKTLVWKEAAIRTSRVNKGEFPRVIRMLEAGAFHPDLLVSGEYPLARTGEAFAVLDREPNDLVKLMIRVG